MKRLLAALITAAIAAAVILPAAVLAPPSAEDRPHAPAAHCRPWKGPRPPHRNEPPVRPDPTPPAVAEIRPQDKPDVPGTPGDGTQYTLASTTYTVQPGDSLWKIAVKFEIGLSELIKANPQLSNPALIYAGQKITIPNAAPLQSVEQEIFRLVNVQRGYANLPLLTYNWQAARVARIKSQDMIDSKYFSHISPTYGSPFKMLESFGLRFSAAAENIAMGQRTAQEVMNTWMNSPGHKANILSRSVTQLGVGVAKASNGTLYFTQLFLKPVG